MFSGRAVPTLRVIECKNNNNNSNDLFNNKKCRNTVKNEVRKRKTQDEKDVQKHNECETEEE